MTEWIEYDKTASTRRVYRSIIDWQIDQLLKRLQGVDIEDLLEYWRIFYRGDKDVLAKLLWDKLEEIQS